MKIWKFTIIKIKSYIFSDSIYESFLFPMSLKPHRLVYGIPNIFLLYRLLSQVSSLSDEIAEYYMRGPIWHNCSVPFVLYLTEFSCFLKFCVTFRRQLSLYQFVFEFPRYLKFCIGLIYQLNQQNTRYMTTIPWADFVF